ncbi:H-X9-DG-CTERM domain-containing protein [Posidoniimonas polymericola]|uniref:H-X9-DG-CTERM domain-containing protein n=1 Tax=Posidoniimonas polymericola TaxID=2528002 RepID=UPI0037039124
MDELRICPEDPRGPERLRKKLTSYVLNDYVTVPRGGAITSLHDLPATHATVVALEASDNLPLSFYHEHIHAKAWFKRSNVRDRLVWSAVQEEMQSDRHTSGSHLLYADAHVEFVAESTLRELADHGDNFMLPPQ